MYGTIYQIETYLINIYQNENMLSPQSTALVSEVGFFAHEM